MTPKHVTPVHEPDALLTPSADAGTTEGPGGDSVWDIVDQWGVESFPASDPPANW